MVHEISERQSGSRSRAAGRDALFSGALGESLRSLDGQSAGLVYQPAALVGTSNSGLVSGRRGQVPGRFARTGLEARFGCARYLVFIVALAVRDDGRDDAEKILSDDCARHGP